MNRKDRIRTGGRILNAILIHVHSRHCRIRPVTCWLMILLFTSDCFAQGDIKSRVRALLVNNVEERGRFIVAFELSPENGFDFTWPFESMQPAPYEAVVMAVEKMPRVRDENNADDQSEALVASRCLKINGRLQKPHRVVNRQTYFLVKLKEGRLRVSLRIPPGFVLDPQHKTAAIKLYEVEKD